MNLRTPSKVAPQRPPKSIHPHRGLGDLPVELELAILAQLPLSALPSLACVCRRWHAHLKHLDFIGSSAALRAIRARVAFLLHQHGDRTVCAYLDNSPLDGTPFARSSAPSARRDYRVRNFNDASKRLRRLLVLLREFEGLERRYVESMAASATSARRWSSCST